MPAAFSEDLSEIVEPSAAAGDAAGRAVAAALGAPVESYGKAALVGTAGEQEHAVAIKTSVIGDALRAAIGGGSGVAALGQQALRARHPGGRAALLQGRDLGALALRHDHRRRSPTRRYPTRSC